jgi:hypothetical protein
MRGERTRWARRSFLSRVGAGATAFGATLSAGVLPAQAQPSPADAAGGWHPARHAEDDWFDQTSAQRRFFFDTTTPEALGEALVTSYRPASSP